MNRFQRAIASAVFGLLLAASFAASANADIAPPSISEDFGAAFITQGDSTSLSFTISNPNSATDLTGVSFSDILPPGLALSTPNGLTGSCGGGSITASAGTGNITLNGATVAANDSCTFSVSVTGVSASNLTNFVQVNDTTAGTGNTASASLNINALQAPSISSAFGGASMLVGESTSLSFTITNVNSGSALNGISFTDSLPAGLEVANPSSLAGSCGGGTITAGAGSGSISLSGAVLAASSQCNFSVNVKATTVGTKDNSVEVDDTTAGAGNTSDASINVNTPLAPSISNAFGAASIAMNGSTSLSFTITNPNGGIDLSAISFTDNLPAGLEVSNPDGLTGSCGGGTITAGAGSASISLSGAALAASAQCTFSVNVKGTAAGAKDNSVQVSDTTAGTGNTADASVTVDALLAPSMTKAFGAASIALNGSTSLSFTITNPNVGTDLSAISFTDSLPAGLEVSNPDGLTGSCGGGTITSVAGSGSVSLSGAALAASAQCTFSVNVTGTTAGVKNNSAQVSDTTAGAGNTADASVTVDALLPPSMTKAFGTASMAVNASTSLSFTITNPNSATTLSAISFTDSLPAGLVVSTPNGLAGSCGGGTITSVAGAGSVSLSGAALAASAQCTFSVNVTGTTAGTKNNSVQVSDTTSGAGNTATASITIGGAAPPTIAKAFGAASIPLNGSTSLTFTVTNPNAGATLSAISFTDTLPAGLVVSTPNGLSGSCGGGTITSVAGAGSVSLSAAALASSSFCTFSVNVTGTTGGVKNNSVQVSDATAGAGNTANASITVGAAAPPVIAKAFGAASIALNGSTSLSFTITNPNAGTALSGVAFTDTLPAGLVVSTPSGLTGSCGGGTITSTAGAGSVSLSGAALAASAACTFAVHVTGTSSGLKTNSVSVTSTNAGAGNTASASLTVAAAVAPTVTSVTPAKWSPAGGDTVVLTGTQFIGVTAVTFGGAPATSYVVNSATTITAVTPPHAAGAASVSVTTSGGAGSVSGAYVVAPTTVQVASSLNPSTVGQSVTFTATVASGFGSPTGNVTFLDAGAAIGTGAIAGGKANFTTTALAHGSHTITARYAGDAAFAPSTSAALTQTVNTPLDSLRLHALEVAVTQAEAQSSGDAFSGAVTSAISDGFAEDGGALVTPGQNGLHVNFTDRPGAAGPTAARLASYYARVMASRTNTTFEMERARYAQPGGPAAIGMDRSLTAPLADGGLNTTAASTPLALADANTSPAQNAPAPVTGWRLWADVRGAGWNTDQTVGGIRGGQVNSYVGLTRKLSPSLLVGAMTGWEGFNYTSSSLNGRMKGDGWTAGGYLGWKLVPGVRLDAAFGRSGLHYDGESGAAAGSFSGGRWLANGGLSGLYRLHPVEIEPSAKVYALWETDDAYVDTLGTAQASNRFSLGRASVGAKAAYPMLSNPGTTLAPYAGVYADYYFSSSNAVSLVPTQIVQGWAARVTGGLAYTVSGGPNLSLGAELGGIGSQHFTTWTLRARFSTAF